MTLALAVLVIIIASALVFAQDIPAVLDLTGLLARPAQTQALPQSTPAVSTPPSLGGTGTGEQEMPVYTADGETLMVLQPQPEGEELSLPEIYEKCLPGVVAITSRLNNYSGYWGSGIIMSPDGYIITNAHLLDGVTSVTVTLYDNSEYEAQLVGSDSQSDLAIIKIDAEGLTALEFGDSSLLEVGEEVAAIGNPLGAQLRGTMTNGILSAINRDMPSDGHTRILLQTNTAINDGNSGGPLLNRFGQVIGITNMKLMSAYTSIEGIGFAIPTAVMKEISDDLLTLGFVSGRPGIGVTIGPLTAEERAAYDLPAGLYVDSVSPGSDAYAKGVRPGDVLTAVNGQPVTANSQVNAIKDELHVGDTMTLTLYRNGETFDAEVALMDMSELF